MPPRRRNKASSARSAAIQAVERRRRQQQSSILDDEDEDPHGTSSFLGSGGDSTSITRRSSSSSHSNSNNHHHHNNNNNRSTQPPTTTALLDSKDGCLHCLNYANDSNIQVRCDECQSYICQTCHWCHEFQANHEIRVCDRCDAFYCRNCDEMDQCDDCGEVVCASCSTLLSCKFCGGGLCEECATACGRCGIVLCSRDAKFAVDCDTCRLSYCLVCLASGSKDPCVRCGHRPSKRMEQLVHLRLKSIYKAFKQSSRKANGMTIEELEETKHINNSAHNNHDDEDEEDDEEDETTLLGSSTKKMNSLGGAALSNAIHASSHHGGGNSASHVASSSSSATNLVLETEKYMAEKQKADAAAEALLAELDEEEEAMKSKKNKKKRKKEKKQQQQAKQQQQQQKEEQQQQTQQKQKEQQKAAPETPNSKKKSQNTSISTPSSMTSADRDWQEDTPKNTPTSTAMDPMEKKFLELVEAEDEDGLEHLLFQLKGIPGRASLRKNAKKALKRLRSVAAEEAAAATAESTKPPEPQVPATAATTSSSSNGGGCSELLRLVSDNHVNHSKSNHRVECVMQISPVVVGWVIGKGGQRIRDLMEESGAKVWIDQEKIAKPNDPRNVYISGERQCVDQAVKMMKDIVSTSPAHQSSTAAAATSAQHATSGDGAAHHDARAVATPISNVAGQQMNEPSAAQPPQQQQQQQANPTLISQQIDRALKKAQNQAATKKTAPPAAPKTKPAAATRSKSPLRPAVAAPPKEAAHPTSAAPAPVADSSAIPDNLAEHILTCEARFVPLLIGKRGWTIKNIQDESGARVDIDQTVTPRKIRISGPSCNVDVAISMVRDVLSYPHAQLIQSSTTAEEKQTIDIANQQQATTTTAAVCAAEPPRAPPNGSPERDDHFSPPASLIMTGDSKSLISASSSLSSTPEPSMASSQKGYQLPHGPLIPPEYTSHGNNNNNNNLLRPQGAPTNVFNGQHQHQQQQQEMGFDNTMGGGGGGPHRGFGGPPTYGNPPPSLMGMQHHIPGMSMPATTGHHHHPLPPHHQMYPASKPPMPPPPMGSNNAMPDGFETSMLANLGNNVGLNFGMMGNNNSTGNSPALRPVHPHQLGNSHYNSNNAQESPLRNVVPRGGGLNSNPPSMFHHAESSKLPPAAAAAAGSGGLWGDPSPAPYGGRAGLQQQETLQDGYYAEQSLRNQGIQQQQQSRGRPQDVMTLGGFNIGQAGQDPQTTSSFVPTLDPTNPGIAEPKLVRDDSKMVDSLFAPAGDSDQQETGLLTGFNGLSIDVDGDGGMGAATGLWGGLTSTWESSAGKTSSGIIGGSKQDTSLLSGMPPLHLPDDHHQHPPQSRFNWSSTNA